MIFPIQTNLILFGPTWLYMGDMIVMKLAYEREMTLNDIDESMQSHLKTCAAVQICPITAIMSIQNTAMRPVHCIAL